MNISEASLKKALTWFADKIKSAYDAPPKSAAERKSDWDIYDTKALVKKMSMFHMYTHAYPNPLWKNELPYWDALPLYFPVGMLGPSHGNGAKIQAINIHYLTHNNRIIFIQELYNVVNKSMQQLGYDPDTQGYEELPHAMMTKIVGKHMDAVYRGLTGSEGEKKIRMAYRSYLLKRIGSKIKRIKFSEWENAANLILPQWKKQGESAIIRDINQKYQKYKNRDWEPIW